MIDSLGMVLFWAGWSGLMFYAGSRLTWWWANQIVKMALRKGIITHTGKK